MKTMKTFKAVIETEVSLNHENALQLLEEAYEYVDHEENDSGEDLALKAYNEIEYAVEMWLFDHFDGERENNPTMQELIVKWLESKWDEPWVQDYFKYINGEIDEYSIFDYPIFD